MQMKQLMGMALVAGMAMGMVGCATTTGRPFDARAAETLVDGKTTRDQVRQALGEPETVEDRGDGTTMWIYSFSQSKASFKDYVPFAGGDNHPTRQMLAVVFDHRGVLESHTASQSH